MPKSIKDSPLGCINSDHKPTSRRISLATFLSKQRLPVILRVAIVQEQRRVRIWTLDYLGKFSMRLLDTDLEALASTFLVNRSYIPASLKLVGTSRGNIRATLSSLLPTGQRSMSASVTLYRTGSRKFTGLGDPKQSLTSPPY